MTKEELKKEVTEYLNIQTLPKIDSLVYRVIKNLIFGFAEPREKRIAELEEKLKHAEENCINKTCVVLKDKEDCVAQLAELEKENAELKHTIATLRQEKDNVSMHAKAMEVVAKTKSDHHTKATKIIKKLYAVYYAPCVTESDLKYRDELFAEIKQFLSEVKKWKR